jgi:sulfur carrier protein
MERVRSGSILTVGGATVQVTVNGRRIEFASDLSLSTLVATVSEARSGIAVALNNEVVPRGSWDSVAVVDGDRVEIVTAVQGG